MFISPEKFRNLYRNFNMEIERQWQNKFSEAARRGGEDYQISLWSKEGLKSYLKYFFEYFNPYIKKDNSQTLLLDLGCGPGTFSRLLSQKGFQVYGVDYSEEMIEVAKEKSKGEKINFEAADIYNLPLPEDFFDVVICLGVFQHLEYPSKALKEIKRVLKNEGLVIITTLNSFSLAFLCSKKQPSCLKRYNPYWFKKFLNKENFDKIKLRGIYFFPFTFNFLTNFILKVRIYKLFNLFFSFFIFLSHSFYIEGRKRKN